jgi:hypothetical protein
MLYHYLQIVENGQEPTVLIEIPHANCDDHLTKRGMVTMIHLVGHKKARSPISPLQHTPGVSRSSKQRTQEAKI